MEKLYAKAVKFVVSFRDFFLGLLGVFCVVVAIGMTVADRLPAAGLLFTAGLLLSLFSNLARFEFIKGLGVEAKMLREIDEKVDHVERLAEKVAKTSTVTAEFCMEVMSQIGRSSGPMPRETALKLVRDMAAQLRVLGVEHAKIDALLAPWRKMVTLELLRPTRKAIDEALLRVQQDAAQPLKNSSGMLDTTTPEYLNYVQRNSEVSALYARVNRIWQCGGREDLELIEEVYKEMKEKYGWSIFADQDAVEKSIQHGIHFAVNHEFLDEKYWIDSDPLKTDLQLE